MRFVSFERYFEPLVVPESPKTRWSDVEIRCGDIRTVDRDSLAEQRSMVDHESVRPDLDPRFAHERGCQRRDRNPESKGRRYRSKNSFEDGTDRVLSGQFLTALGHGPQRNAGCEESDAGLDRAYQPCPQTYDDP